MDSQQDILSGITRRYPVIKASGETISETSVEVCTESRVILYLDDVLVGDLSITSTDLEAFATGFLICEGYITGGAQVATVTVSLPEIRVTSGCVPREHCIGIIAKNSSGGSCRVLLPDHSVYPLPDGLSWMPGLFSLRWKKSTSTR